MSYLTDEIEGLMYEAQVAAVRALDVLKNADSTDEELRQMIGRIVDMAQDVKNRIHPPHPLLGGIRTEDPHHSVEM